MNPVPDPIRLLPEKFLGYWREWNPCPLGWLPDVLTTILKGLIIIIIIIIITIIIIIMAIIIIIKL